MQHAVHGAGVVIVRLVGGRCMAAFDAMPYFPRTVHERELSAAAESVRTAAAAQGGSVWHEPTLGSTARPRPAAAVRPLAAAPPPVKDPLGAIDAWQTLEALRLGVVPARGVREYTVARDGELASIDAMLESGQGCRVVWGDYGTGKTHLLEAGEQLALERGYAVARITLDPAEHGLQHPLRLYRAIAEGVRTLQHAQPGIEHVLDRLVDSESHHRPDGAAASRFYSPYLFTARFAEPLLTGLMRDYVRGEQIDTDLANQLMQNLGWGGPKLLRMSDYRTYGRMYVHLVGTLAAWCKDAGLAGLALFFDEVERVEMLSMEERWLALEVFQHYAAVMMTREDLAFDPETLYKGGQSVHKALPLRFREDLPLVGMFALTPLGDIEASYRRVTRSQRYDLRLGPLRKQHLEVLVTRIVALYRRAYPTAVLDDDVIRRVLQKVLAAVQSGDDAFRAVVRATVFALDGARAGRFPSASAARIPARSIGRGPGS